MKKSMTLPLFCPLEPDTDADKLAHGIAQYLMSKGVKNTDALWTAVDVLSAVQTFALEGADAACAALEKKIRKHRQKD